jgi:hypothetical protein
MVERGLANSKGLAKPSEYIPREEIWERFSVTITYGQLDDASDWLKTSLLSPEEVEELMKQTAAAQDDLLANASSHLKDKITQHLVAARDSLAKKLVAPTPGQPKPRFHTAWLTNFQTLVDLLPGFDLSGDPNIPSLITDLQPCLKHTAETMKDSEVAQSEARATIDMVINKYRPWLNS